MYSRFIIFSFTLSGMSQIMTKIKFYCRGLHHSSIFSYKIPSHEFMSKLIEDVHITYYNVIDSVYLDVLGLRKTEDSVFCDYEYISEYVSAEEDIPEEEREKAIDFYFERCIDRLSQIQGKIVEEITKLFEDYEKKARELGFEARWYDACDEIDACYLEFFLIVHRNNLVQHILRAQFEISTIDGDVATELELKFRTGIYVAEKPIPISLLDNRISLLRLSLPDGPDKEQVEEIELEPNPYTKELCEVLYPNAKIVIYTKYLK